MDEMTRDDREKHVERVIEKTRAGPSEYDFAKYMEEHEGRDASP